MRTHSLAMGLLLAGAAAAADAREGEGSRCCARASTAPTQTARAHAAASVLSMRCCRDEPVVEAGGAGEALGWTRLASSVSATGRQSTLFWHVTRGLFEGRPADVRGKLGCS